MKFSLIVATLGRAEVLEQLFQSIESQSYPDLECIVVDQNPDDRVERIVERWNCRLPLRRVTSSPGLSRARNVGLAHATGDIVAFPDDDCWYSESLLSNVASWFELHPRFGVLTVGSRDLDGTASGNRWFQDRCRIRAHNAFRTTFSSTIFVRRSPAMETIRFDESLGVGSGTAHICGEETDYVLRLLRAGERGYFDRTWYIGHPLRDMLSGRVDVRRAIGYGCGMGRVLRLHSQPLLMASFLAYDLARSVLVRLRGDRTAAELCLRHACGVAAGYLELPEKPSSVPGRSYRIRSRVAAFLSGSSRLQPVTARNKYPAGV